jgi:hypothetical protein
MSPRGLKSTRHDPYDAVMDKPSLTVIPGKRDEIEKELVRMMFTPGPTPKEWRKLTNCLTRRGHLQFVPVKNPGGQ